MYLVHKGSNTSTTIGVIGVQAQQSHLHGHCRKGLGL
jgi:hypothetical protein